jgi:hypothetical protein
MGARTPPNSTRRMLSLISMVAGALLLLLMPLAYFVTALGDSTNVNLPGTLLIVSATAGMALLGLGAALRE